MGQTVSRKSVINTLKRHKAEIVKEYPVRRIAIFGSIAREEHNELSDIDILVDVDPSIGLRFVNLADRLQELLRCEVDLVSIRGLKPSFLKMIEAESIDV
jgi:uncharacterized protein